MGRLVLHAYMAVLRRLVVYGCVDVCVQTCSDQKREEYTRPGSQVEIDRDMLDSASCEYSSVRSSPRGSGRTRVRKKIKDIHYACVFSIMHRGYHHLIIAIIAIIAIITIKITKHPYRNKLNKTFSSLSAAGSTSSSFLRPLSSNRGGSSIVESVSESAASARRSRVRSRRLRWRCASSESLSLWRSRRSDSGEGLAGISCSCGLRSNLTSFSRVLTGLGARAGESLRGLSTPVWVSVALQNAWVSWTHHAAGQERARCRNGQGLEHSHSRLRDGLGSRGLRLGARRGCLGSCLRARSCWWAAGRSCCCAEGSRLGCRVRMGHWRGGPLPGL